jgi:HK97 family phage major capsid protein
MPDPTPHVPYQRSNVWESMEFKALGSAIDTKMNEMLAMNAGDALKSASPEVLTDLQTRNEELKAMRVRFAALREATEAFQQQVNEHKAFTNPNRNGIPFAGEGDPSKPDAYAYKSLGELFTESDAYKQGIKSLDTKMRPLEADINGVSIKSLSEDYLKTTMATTAGWAPFPTQLRAPVMTAQTQPVVADLIPQDDTTEATIQWYEETVYTNAAASVAEGATKPEAALQAVLRQQPVVKIAVTLPVTDEQLMDVPQVRGYIDSRLTLMVKQQEQVQLLRGTGVSPQLQGFHTKPGIGSIARGSNEDNADVFLRAITQVNAVAGLANATGIVMNPLQWLAIRLVRTSTGDYMWGHPALVGPATLWGLPVVQTNAETAGLGLVGDFQMYSHISRRLGMRIDVGYINTDFKDNIQRIRVEERLSLEIYRASAFCEATNLNAAP